MPIKVVLRKDGAISPFRRLLHMMLLSPLGDSVVLCSGYIWEPDTGYAVLSDGLLPVLQSACASGTLTTVAGKFYPDYYRGYYANFVNRIRATGIAVDARYAPKKNWHAKIAIKTDRGRPVAALIGSSNLTGPAYGESRYRWNYEADVLIWLGSASMNGYFRDDALEQEFGKFELTLAPDVRQPSEEVQLKAIYGDVFDTEMEDFRQ